MQPIQSSPIPPAATGRYNQKRVFIGTGNPMAYSLWLSPDEQQTRRIQRKIDQLAERVGSTSFAPHVTVSSGIEHKPTTTELRQLAKRHCKPSLAALRVEHSRLHHECLKLALHRDRELMALRADALSSFEGQKKTAPYKPHISLLYAKLSAAKRQQLARQIPASLLKRCTGNKLQLVLTQGPERDWKVIEQVELGETQ